MTREKQEYQTYLIPKDLRSSFKMGIFTLMDIIIIGACLIVAMMITSQLNVGVIMNIIIWIVHLFIGIVLIIRTKDNPDRPLLSVLYSALINQDSLKYKSIDFNTYRTKRKG